MRLIQKGSVDRSVDLYIIDSTDGTPEVGVLFNTAGIDLKYRRDLSAAVSITEATLAALTTAHTDGGFLEIGNGVYRLDVPDAAWATGADHVTIFGTVTGMIVLPVTVQLVDYNPEEALATPTNITAATGVVLSGVTHTGAVIPTVTTLTGHTAQTGDAFARLGAPSGASVSADIAGVQSDTNDIQTRIPAALVGGRMDSSVGAAAANTLTASALATDAVNEIADGIRARQLTESYAADGVAPTLEQAVLLIQQMLTEMSIAGTTMTIKKLDGTTTAATLTLNDATTPTSVTRAT